MLKFIKHHMTSIGHIEFYPLIAFLIFFSMFLCACWLAFRASKSHIDEMGNIPLED